MNLWHGEEHCVTVEVRIPGSLSRSALTGRIPHRSQDRLHILLIQLPLGFAGGAPCRVPGRGQRASPGGSGDFGAVLAAGCRDGRFSAAKGPHGAWCRSEQSATHRVHTEEISPVEFLPSHPH